MGLTHVIGPGEREWFRRCRRAWDFGSPNRQNLEPRNPAPGVDIAGAVRAALAVWYFPGMWEWPRTIVLPRALQAFDQAVAARRPAPEDERAGAAGGTAPEDERAGAARGPAPDDDAIGAARRMLERYFAWAQTVDAFAPVRVEADFEANIPDRRTPGHDMVDADGRPVRYHDRLPVLIVDASDVYWVVEHRIVDDGWADPEELLLAERPVAAAWGWEQFYLGMVIAGTVHNELRLPVTRRAGDDAAERAAGRQHDELGEGRLRNEGEVGDSDVRNQGQLGQGAAARRPRARDWARSRAARQPAASSAGSAVIDDGPAEPVVEEGGAEFRRTWVRRSRAEVEAVGELLSAVAREMLDPGLALYPTPIPEHCSRCAYRPPCLAMTQGTDVGAILSADYQTRAPDDPEEGRLGGGSWSMNRGAAPPPKWRSPPPS